MTNNIKFVMTRFVFSSSKCTKICFWPGDPAGGAYIDAPPDPLVGWGGGYPFPIALPARRIRRLELGASVLRPPQHKILATPVSGQSWSSLLLGRGVARNLFWGCKFFGGYKTVE